MTYLDEKTTGANTGFASGGLTCKLGALCFYSSSVLIDSSVLRNPPERKARKRYMPLKMNSQLNYSLDDIAQIYLTSLDNLTYELIQAERSFGFGNKTFTNPTSEQIDLAITSRKQISESAIKRLLNLLNSDSNLPKLKLMCDGKVANGNGFGFKDFAIIVDQSYIWLLRRKA